MTFREFCALAAQKIYDSPRCPEEQKDRGTALFESETLVKFFAGEKYVTYAGGESIPPELEEELFSALSRKLGGEPLQYILGEWDFYGLRMYCGNGCLIPRPETEFLVEYAVRKLPAGGRFLDLCTGSGCIAAAILKNRHDASGTAVDISGEALEYARKNCEYHSLAARLEIVLCDIREYIPDGKYDMIISNPPYIKSADMKKLSDEVKKEPYIALDGGEDGLDFYRTIIERYRDFLNPGGAMAFEAGFDTTHEVVQILSASGFRTEIIYDYSKIPRIAVGKGKTEDM